MRTTIVGRYAMRMTFGESSIKSATDRSFSTATDSSDRVLTRSAICMALFGISLSSFSLKQMCTSSSNSMSTRIPIRKF